MTQLEETFASKPRAEWLRILAEHDIPAAGTQSIHDFMRDPAVLHHQMVVQYDHPERGPLTLMGQPLRFSETQAEDAGPPPTLGQHTDDILHQAGYADAEIADLRRRGVVGGKPPAGA
jgi:crotonobetainyl-CoA:carnitine CoA-transferase CaiB-like acyl-CoA transferase